MTHICDNCHRTFEGELALELHRDSCTRDTLFCRQCGGRFSESRATRDGWHYRCPDEDCDAEGLGEDLVHLEQLKIDAR